MPRMHNPRRGSMQFWHRKRAKRPTARVRQWAVSKETKPLGFAGYKAGMTHVMMKDTRANSLTKGEEIRFPATVVECPPLKVFGVRYYGHGITGLNVISHTWDANTSKELARALRIPKQPTPVPTTVPQGCTSIRLLLHTQPRLIGLKKTPEILEFPIGGPLQDAFAFATSHLGKEITVQDVVAEGQQLDTRAVTTGRGVQGPRRRFGIMLLHHKTQKGIRRPATTGPWNGNHYWRVAKAGQTGYQQRTQYNAWVLKIGTDPKMINPAGGFLRYGMITHPFLLVKGSIGGPEKRLVTFTHAIRPNHRIPKQPLTITFVSTLSKQ